MLYASLCNSVLLSIGVLVQKAKNLELEVYIPVRPICGYFGLAWSRQLQRIKRQRCSTRRWNSYLLRA